MPRCRPPPWRETSRACRAAPRRWSVRRERISPAACASGWRRRAFFRGAPLVVLDDPCSALDPATEQEYIHHVRRLARAGAVCVVSGTGKALLTAADRIVVLRHGSIEATGTLRELLAGGGELSLLWDSQQ